jgi:hypothetical protein
VPAWTNRSSQQTREIATTRGQFSDFRAFPHARESHQLSRLSIGIAGDVFGSPDWICKH